MKDNKLIYDIGFHKGEDTGFYLSQGYNVIAIEADPELYNKGKTKFKKEINSGNLVLLNLASKGGDEVIPADINTTTFDKILSKYGVPYYLKIAIENNDHYCIKALKDFKLPIFISTESESSDR